MTEQKSLNLYQKIVEIRKSIDVFTKDSKSYGYNYVSGSQVLKKIKDKMDELQVLLIPGIPDEVKHETYDYTVWDKNAKQEKEKTDFVISGTITYTWINAENPEEKLVVPWKVFGQQDDISKAFGSGLTYSERYFLLKSFNVPTDEDDPDTKETNNRSSKPKGIGNKPLASEKQLNLINKLVREVATFKACTEEQSYTSLRKHMIKDMEYYTIEDASKAIGLLNDALKQGA
jgi:hypothetical protein